MRRRNYRRRPSCLAYCCVPWGGERSNIFDMDHLVAAWSAWSACSTKQTKQVAAFLSRVDFGESKRPKKRLEERISNTADKQGQGLEFDLFSIINPKRKTTTGSQGTWCNTSLEITRFQVPVAIAPPRYVETSPCRERTRGTLESNFRTGATCGGMGRAMGATSR